MSELKRQIIETADGSKTIQIVDWEEQYHSKHGALQEAYHVFIKQGLDLFKARELAVLEVGFGTGLNALISFVEAPKRKLNIHYTALEAYPVSLEEVVALDYSSLFEDNSLLEVSRKMHESPWEVEVELSSFFRLMKRQMFFQDLAEQSLYHLIYFDAFGFRVQPELWSEAIFAKMYDALQPQGVLVTYAAKGSVRRAMQAVGFTVERLPGPPGKREMLRATKS